MKNQPSRRNCYKLLESQSLRNVRFCGIVFARGKFWPWKFCRNLSFSSSRLKCWLKCYCTILKLADSLAHWTFTLKLQVRLFDTAREYLSTLAKQNARNQPKHIKKQILTLLSKICSTVDEYHFLFVIEIQLVLEKWYL